MIDTQIQISGICRVCREYKEEFISIVFPNYYVLAMCMDCYTEIMKAANIAEYVIGKDAPSEGTPTSLRT